MASLLIPGAKDDGGVRPIAISECFYKLASMYAMALVGDSLPAIFEPIQLGVGAKGGAGRALHVLQAGLETMGPDTILLKCDIKNAFNERKRGHILTELYKVQSLQPIWRIAHWAYKDVSELLLFDHGRYCETILSAEGVKQGDCLGSLLFAVSMQPIYRRCILGSGNVRCIAVADDLNLVGQASAVFKAFDKFGKDLSGGSGLVLQKSKCAMLWPRANLPDGIRTEATKRGLSYRVGTMETLGGLVGQGDDAFNQWLAGNMDSFKGYFDMLLHPELPVQVAMLLLRLSAVPRIGFLTTVMPPRLLEAHAKRFDELVLSTFIRKCGLPNTFLTRQSSSRHCPSG